MEGISNIVKTLTFSLQVKNKILDIDQNLQVHSNYGKQVNSV